MLYFVESDLKLHPPSEFLHFLDLFLFQIKILTPTNTVFKKIFARAQKLEKISRILLFAHLYIL